jgi:hypothetical protein
MPNSLRERCRCGAECEATVDASEPTLTPQEAIVACERLLRLWRSQHSFGCRYMKAQIGNQGDPDGLAPGSPVGAPGATYGPRRSSFAPGFADPPSLAEPKR